MYAFNALALAALGFSTLAVAYPSEQHKDIGALAMNKRQDCSSGDDCDELYACFDGVCEANGGTVLPPADDAPSCKEDKDCDSGFVCEEGLCCETILGKRQTEGDHCGFGCYAGYVCKDGLCMPE